MCVRPRALVSQRRQQQPVPRLSNPLRSQVLVARASAAEQQQQQKEADDQVAWDEDHEAGDPVEVIPGKVCVGLDRAAVNMNDVHT